MTDNSHGLLKETPQEIFNYINKYYVESLLSDVTSEVDDEFNVFFNLSASLEDAIYHLKFDSDGTMVQRTVEPLNEFYFEGYTDYDN